MLDNDLRLKINNDYNKVHSLSSIKYIAKGYIMLILESLLSLLDYLDLHTCIFSKENYVLSFECMFQQNIYFIYFNSLMCI